MEHPRSNDSPRPAALIENVAGISPITALCSFNSGENVILLVGEGPLLKVYQDAAILGHGEYLGDSTIHGIVAQRAARDDESVRRVLIFGGRRLSLLEIRISAPENRGSRLTISVIKRCHVDVLDRVITACFRPQAYASLSRPLSTEVAFLTYNNELFRASFKGSVEETLYKEASVYRLTAGPHVLLYSAQIIWQTLDCLFVASGTAFGEVLVWSAQCNQESPQAGLPNFESSILHRFVGHEGSIFGVRFSESEPLAESTGAPRYVASCSDDRTIRIWNLTSILHREGSESLDDGDGRDVALCKRTSNEYIAKVMGHGSRIWGIRFLCSERAKGLYVLSYGEDSTTQLWRLDLDSQQHEQPTGSPVAVSCHDFHTGKNVWAVEAVNVGYGQYALWSGGADGRVVKYDINLNRVDLGGSVLSFSIQDLYAELNTALDSNKVREASQSRNYKREIFENLAGEWRIQRTLTSILHNYPSGTFIGTVFIHDRKPTDKKYPMEHIYSEKGTFTMDSGASFDAVRSYVYRYNAQSDEISAWFVRPDDLQMADYLFHVVRFDDTDGSESASASDSQTTVKARGSHLCVNDTYDAQYEFTREGDSLNEWSLKYFVKGPRKDYSAESTYSKATQLIDPSHSQVDGARPPTRMSMDQSDIPTMYDPTDSFKSYGWVTDHDLLATTDRGTLFHAQLKDLKHEVLEQNTPVVQWTYICQEQSLRLYSTIASLPEKQIMFIAGRDGSIFRYSYPTCKLTAIRRAQGSKVSFLSAHLLQVKASTGCLVDKPPEAIFLLATTIGSALALTYILGMNAINTDEAVPEAQAVQLPAAFVPTSCCISPSATVLVLGSRHGSLAVYRRPTTGANGDFKLVEVISDLHGVEMVTAIRVLPNQLKLDQRDDETIHLLTTGRNSCFAIHRLFFSAPSVQGMPKYNYEKIHEGWPSFGPNVEGAYMDPSRFKLLLWGFRSKHFVIWDEFTKQEIFKVDCGGCHRNWAFIPSIRKAGSQFQGGSFVWTQAGKCMIKRQTQISHEVIQEGGHGREIKAVAITHFPSKSKSSRGRTLIATGSEDTMIRLFEICEDDTSPHSVTKIRLNCRTILKKHSAGLQQLHWSTDGSFLFSAAGFEEFYVWKISQVSGFGIGAVALASAPPVSTSKELRIMDCDVTEETEIGHRQVALAYSDGTFRVFDLHLRSPGQASFELVFQGNYGQRCLTQIRGPDVLAQRCILVTATDGHVGIYPDPNSRDDPKTLMSAHTSRDPPTSSIVEVALLRATILNCLQTHRIHQSAIHRLINIKISNDASLLVTAGDDGALGFTILQKRPHISQEELSLEADYHFETSTTIIPKAHAAAITGLAHLGNTYSSSADSSSTTMDHGDRKYGPLESLFDRQQEIVIVTTGPDQMVKLWGITLIHRAEGPKTDSVQAAAGEEGRLDSRIEVKVRKLGKVETSIGDVSACEYLDDGRVEGMEKGSQAESLGKRQGGLLVVVGVGMEVFRFNRQNGSLKKT